MGMTPSFSPSMGSAKSENASLISASSCAVMSCSLASLDCLAPALPGAPDSAAPPDFRFGGCFGRGCQIDETTGDVRNQFLGRDCMVLTMVGFATARRRVFDVARLLRCDLLE